MDSRRTLSTNETFLELLNAALRQREKVYFLTDVDGINRKEGFIKRIDTNGPSTLIEMEDGSKVEIGTIVAANGIFRPEYSEC